MKIALIGGNGFIGSHIVDRLLASGEHKLTVFGRSSSQFSSRHDEVDYIYGDFENGGLLSKAIEGCDVVVHLLSTTVPSTAAQDPAYDVRSNLLGTIRLLEEIARQKIGRLIYVSSGGTVYGDPLYIPMDELHPLQPISAYGITKAAIERYVMLYAEKYGFSYMIVRPSNPYGPRQSLTGMQGVISTFLYRMLMDEPITVWGDGSAVRDYVHISDVTDFFIRGINGRYTGIYNLGYGTGYSVNEIISVVESVTKKKAEVIYSENRSSNVKEVVLDIRHATEELGWSPKINLIEGISNHFEWLSNEIMEVMK